MNYIKNYEFWLEQEQLDAYLKHELLGLSDEEIKEAFYTELGFGTGGLRGLMGVGTNRINVYTIRRATLGFARFLKKSPHKGGVAISYDNRKDSQFFAKQAAMVLAHEGITTYLFKSLRPTPMLSFAVRHFKCAGGIMITASHNPKAYNGYKAYDHTGAQLNLKDASEVIREISQIDTLFDIPVTDNQLIHYIDEDFDNIYLNRVKEVSIHHEEKKVKIVYSPLHGAGGPVIPKFLKNEGYEIYPYLPEMEVDSTFGTLKSSNPEEGNAFERTINFAKKINADIVMVTDPDADRLGIAVKHHDQFRLLTGNQTAAIELYYILSERKKLDTLPAKGAVYTTNVTTEMIDVIAKSFGMKVVTTLTGFKFIGEKAEAHKDTHEYLFGCEESYGSLIKDFVRDKDAVQAVYLLAEIANHLKLQHKTIIDYLEEIYQAYGYYFEYTHSMTLAGILGIEKIDLIMDYFRRRPLQIEGRTLLGYDDILKGIHVEGENQEKLSFPESNVLKYYYDENTWVVLRPSGTEPKIKIYYGTKAKSMQEAQSFIHDLNKHVLAMIESL
jgi:phosphoglucomutase